MHPKLQKEFERWRAQLPTDYPSERLCVGPEEVLRAHFLIADYFISIGEEDDFLDIGPRSVDLLLSAVDRQHVGIGGARKWNTLFELTATLFYGLVKNHAFHDANKRTALLVALHQLDRGKRIPTVKHTELDELAVRTARNSLAEYPAYESFAGETDADVRFLARQFKRITREVDSRQYGITYRQLDTILHRWNARLVASSGNFADVMQTQEERVGLFGLKKRTVERRVLQIGFHSWTSQVFEANLKAVRDALHLTPDHGVDSQTFFQGADVVESLILQYSGPLRRLRNK